MPSIVKLTLESNQYERGIRNAKKQWDEFMRGIGLSASKFTAASAAIAGVTGALKIAKDAFFANEQTLDEWGRTVKSAESVYNGFLSSLNNGNISGFLTNINNIVKAARDAYDALDELATYNAFNQINLSEAQANMTQIMADYRMGEASKEQVLKAADELKTELTQRQTKEWDAYIAAVRSAAANRHTNPDDVIRLLGGKYVDFENQKNSNLVGSGSKLVYNALTKGYQEQRFAVTNDEKLSEFARQLNDEELDALQRMGAQAKLTAREVANVDKQVARLMKTASGDGSVSGSNGSKSGSTKTSFIGGSIGALTQEIAELRKKQQEVTDTNGWKEYEDKINAVIYKVKELKGELGAGGLANASGVSVAGMISLPTRDDLRNKADERIGNFSLAEKKEVKLNESLSNIASGISSMASGIEGLGIELPEGINKTINGIQSVANILTGISTIVSVIQAIAAADTIIPFARGGKVPRAAKGFAVPGNFYSGDMTPIMANAGEVVLNLAQSNNIASMLQSAATTTDARPYVEGENIILGINNSLSRSGKGEIVTTGMLRSMGLTK